MSSSQKLVVEMKTVPKTDWPQLVDYVVKALTQCSTIVTLDWVGSKFPVEDRNHMFDILRADLGEIGCRYNIISTFWPTTKLRTHIYLSED